MDIEEYKHLVLFVCFALVAVALWVFANYPIYMPVLLAPAAALPLFVRQLKSRPVKMLSYLSLGFVSYLTVAESFIVPVGSEELLLSFLPFLLFAIANAIGVIIGYSDSYIFGGVYCVGSVLALLYGKGPLDFVSIDRFVIGIILFTCSSFTFVHLISRKEKSSDSVIPLVSACVIAAILLTILFSLRFFNMDMVYQGSFDEVSRKVSPLFVNMLWLSLVSNGFVILVALIAHDLTMYAFELRRELRNGEVTYYRGVAKEEKSEEEEEDPFSSIVLRLRKFIQDLPEYEGSAASNVLTRFDAEFNALSSQYKGGSKEKAKSLLAKAKRMVKELTESEEPRKPPKLSFKKSDMIELPKNTTLLVEGSIGSRKEECCLRFLKLELQKGKKAAICSYEPEAELQWFSEEERSRIGLFKVEPNITEMSLTITNAVESKPEIVYFNILYKLLPAYSSDVLAEFISSNLRKLKKVGITGIFVMEEEMISTQMLSTIESLFDGIVEFQIREEGDELTSYYRVKEFKLKKFETTWKEFK